MRKTLATAFLVLALSCPTWAGIMQTPPAPEPPPASATQETAGGVTLNGIIHIPPGVSEIALELLTLLPSLL